MLFDWYTRAAGNLALKKTWGSIMNARLSLIDYETKIQADRLEGFRAEIKIANFYKTSQY